MVSMCILEVVEHKWLCLKVRKQGITIKIPPASHTSLLMLSIAQ